MQNTPNNSQSSSERHNYFIDLICMLSWLILTQQNAGFTIVSRITHKCLVIIAQAKVQDMPHDYQLSGITSHYNNFCKCFYTMLSCLCHPSQFYSPPCSTPLSTKWKWDWRSDGCHIMFLRKQEEGCIDNKWRKTAQRWKGNAKREVRLKDRRTEKKVPYLVAVHTVSMLEGKGLAKRDTYNIANHRNGKSISHDALKIAHIGGLRGLHPTLRKHSCKKIFLSLPTT